MMTTMTMMRLLRFTLLLSTTWASSWQQGVSHLPNVRDATAQQSPETAHSFAPPNQDSVASLEHAVVPHEQQQEDEDRLDPINLEHVSLSLRLTCEMNRRLLEGIKSNSRHQDCGALASSNNQHANPLLQRGGDDALVTPHHHPVNIHPSQSWQPPISLSGRESEEEVSLFHAKTPRATTKRQRRGVARWGPELLPYLQFIVKDILQIPREQTSLILALALVYLDRACSVETLRSSGCPKVPFLIPRTIHRLVLMSLLTAARAVSPQQQGNEDNESRITKSLGISPFQLEQMQHAFMHALGDHGLYVDPVVLQEFRQKWHYKFHGRQQQQQQIWA